MDAVRTGAVFSLLQGAFYQARASSRRPSPCVQAPEWQLAALQIGNMMSGKKSAEEDLAFMHTKNMLLTLGLQRFEKNFRKGQLDDLTLPLLTDRRVRQARLMCAARARL